MRLTLSLAFEASLVYKVQITKPAKTDARDYAEYIRAEHKSDESARRWLEGLEEEVMGLTHFPNRFPVIPEAEELGFPYRALIYFSHRVVFSVDDSIALVVIHRIYHSARRAMDQNELLDPE
jgi:plasmid stabilization system protein ParE